ncbi:MAG TPA: SMC-Scp complex subunit ScpB [Candidatus Binatia bacterium]|nr:SMC-Scp complex subunit ScpB [Candidatus Binatia bacterium]
MSLKAKVEAIIYATEEPVTLEQLASVLGEAVLAEPQSGEQGEMASFGGQLPSAGDPGKEQKPARDRTVRARLGTIVEELIADYAAGDRGMEIRQIAGGYRMATRPEHHDVVANFAKSLRPPVRLSLQALETLSVIAYKQPVTVPEISEIRGVDSAGVIATLLDRKLITTAGRKQVIGRPILYRTTKEFLLRFGLNDICELPSMEEFEKLGEPQTELFAGAAESNTSPSQRQENEPVTEAVPEPGSHLMGEPAVPAEGTFATEAQPGESQEK